MKVMIHTSLMATLRLIRGPLTDDQYRQIREKYDRMTGSSTKPENFRRWLQESPSGPAFHALIEDHDRVAGHCCLIPFPYRAGDQLVTAAKAEYLFVEEEYRKTPIEGYEESESSMVVTFLRELYTAAEAMGWGPYFLSSPPWVSRTHHKAGCRPFELPLHECILTLRPLAAALRTPNLTLVRRAAMLGVGLAQQAVRLLTPLFGTKSIDTGSALRPRLRIPDDEAFRAWRYDPAQYEFVSAGGAELVVKRGGAAAYARVVEARVSGRVDVRAMIRRLAQIARDNGALGVRWAVYDDGVIPKELVTALKRNGFACVARKRELLTYAEGTDRVLAPGTWDANDFYVTFDTA